MKGVSCERRKVKGHASNSTPGSSHRGGCSSVAGQSLHSHAGIDQVDSEWRRRHCCGVVAAECFWAVSFSVRRPHLEVMTAGEQSLMKTGLANARSRQRNPADICHKEIL